MTMVSSRFGRRRSKLSLLPLRTPCTDIRHRPGRLGSLDTRRGTPYLSKTASAPGVRARAMGGGDGGRMLDGWR
jgi:hypothetical protein